MGDAQNSVDYHTINKLIAGDKSAFALIYNHHSEKAYRLAYRFLKNKEQSEEIVQETFIKLWLGREKLNPEGNIWLYIYVIAKRLSLNALREIYKSAALTENLFSCISEACNGTEEYVLGNDLERFTEKVISKLPPQQQLIFRLSRIEGLTHKEIAEQLQISPNTVKNHMVEALKTLRTHLSLIDLIGIHVVIFLKYFF